MPRYLHSSIEKIERIEILMEIAGFDAHRVCEDLRDVAAEANVPIAVLASAVNDFLRGLSHAEADSLIKNLTERTKS